MYKIRFADGREYEFKTREEYEQKRNELREQAPELVNPPGPKKLISNLAETAGDLLVGGMAPAAVSRARLDVCISCPYFEKASGRCRICGCFMKAKAKVALAECPAKKWPDQSSVPLRSEPKEDNSGSFSIRNPNRSAP